MKYILYIFFFFICLLCKVSAQNVKSYIVIPGEYIPLGLDQRTNKPYYTTGVVPALVTGAPSNVSQVIGGPHNTCLIDSIGQLWCMGQNPNGVVPDGTTTDRANPVLCATDSAGATIDPVIQCILGGNGNHGAFWNGFIVTNTGFLYGFGELEGYVRGNGTAGAAINTRPVKIVISAFITKVQGGYGMLAIDSSGGAWTWGADKNAYILGQGASPASIPTKITLPAGVRAVDIAHNGLFGYIIGNNGHWYATGSQFYTDYLGMYPTLSMTTSWQDITSVLALPATTQRVWINSESTYTILNDGTLWAWGGAGFGTIGNGLMLNYNTYTPPYDYNGAKSTLQQFNPVQIAVGISDFDSVMTGLTNCFYVYARRKSGQLYSWGRNKTSALSNGIIGANPTNGNITSTYPDSWEIPWIAPINPLALTQQIQSTSPYCLLNPSGFPCNTYPNPTYTNPTARLVLRQIPGTLNVEIDATTSTDNVWITSYLVTHTVGASVPKMGIQAAPKDTAYNVPVGAHTFQEKVTNNGFKSDSVSVSINVLPPSSIQYSPGQIFKAH